MVDTSGAVVNSYAYDVWGNITSQKEETPNPFKYTGEVYDEETGLYYLRARYYDPSIGRFLNEDTYEGQIDNPLSQNLYTYVSNNPLIYSDPSGHRQEWGSGGGGMGNSSYVDLTSLTQLQLTAIIADNNQPNATRQGAMDEIVRRNFLLVENGAFIAAKSVKAAINGAKKAVKAGESVKEIQNVISTTRVGQWMSKTEYADFVKNGIIPRTNVLTKGKEGFIKQANKGDYFVEFDIDSSLLMTKDIDLGWSLVKSKNQMQVKLAEKKGLSLPDPIGTNIKHVYTKN
jgi:RHS repeat-associated protein